jgi:hypothetical protein
VVEILPKRWSGSPRTGNSYSPNLSLIAEACFSFSPAARSVYFLYSNDRKMVFIPIVIFSDENKNSMIRVHKLSEEQFLLSFAEG